MGLSNGTVASVTNEVLNNALDNAMAIERTRLQNEIDWTGVSKKDKEMYLNGITEMIISQKIKSDVGWYTQLLETSKAVAEQMMLIKTVCNFFSPLALSLNAEFSKQSTYDTILKEKDKNGNLKYPTYQEAMAEFSRREPTHVLDLVPHTKSTQGNYPETQQVFDFLQNHSDLVKEFPYGSAILNSRQGTYSPQAYQLELMLSLRRREAPPEYLDSLRNALGNDVYYNFMRPMIMADPAYATGNKLTYAGITKLKDLAHAYGKLDNPSWYAQSGPNGNILSQSTAYTTWNQVVNMFKPENIKKLDGAVSPDDQVKFQALIQLYQEKAKMMAAYKAAGDKTDYYAARDAWYNECNVITGLPEFANQQYFITSVLMKYPTL